MIEAFPRCHSGAAQSAEPGIHNPGAYALPYYVYLMASGKHGTLYVGVTNDLVRWAYEHKSKAVLASHLAMVSTASSGSNAMTNRCWRSPARRTSKMASRLEDTADR